MIRRLSFGSVSEDSAMLILLRKGVERQMQKGVDHWRGKELNRLESGLIAEQGRSVLRPYEHLCYALGDGDFGAEVDVLDRVQELDAFLHGALKGFAAGDQAGAAGAFVDDGGGHGFLEVVGTGGAAAVY